MKEKRVERMVIVALIILALFRIVYGFSMLDNKIVPVRTEIDSAIKQIEPNGR